MKLKGVYILLISIAKDIRINIGSLGKIKFSAGNYVYVGSAQNNIMKRIERHKSKTKNKFWHIDYLLDSKYAKILKIFYKESKKSEECRIANRLLKNEILIKNFGCSDCNCKSHLFKIKNIKNILKLGMKIYKW
ncbi:MAG: GIY-YIG nuclease family protein [Candidatus Aenigmatarchaeota archaeon]